jgi:hypothetical protein
LRANKYSALSVVSETKYNSLYLPTYTELGREGLVRMAEISFEIEACTVLDNGGGVSAEHNQLEYSNNVWIWQVGNYKCELVFYTV